MVEREEGKQESNPWKNAVAIRFSDEYLQTLEDLRRIYGSGTAHVLAVGIDWAKWATVLAASGYDIAIIHDNGRRQIVSNEELRKNLLSHPEEVPDSWLLND